MTSAAKPRLGFIGPGTVGTALARALAGAGYAVVAVSGRDEERLARAVARIPTARAAGSSQEVVDSVDLVFLTVPDGAIRPAAECLANLGGKALVHCSGADSLDVLAGASAKGASVGCFHPLQTFASVEQALRNLPGSAFAVEASSPELERTLSDMARALGGTPLPLRANKALYHASAVIACNYLVTLLDVAAGLWSSLGLTKAEGLKALLPLVRGTIENLEAVGLPNALTGPVARGDVGTVERNLAALDKASPEAARLYAELARRTIPIARAKGTLSAQAADRLLARLEKR
jgi:predicted short-subunit dehydrogenase-like oxidoreductase (DUF2520 family)